MEQPGPYWVAILHMEPMVRSQLRAWGRGSGELEDLVHEVLLRAARACARSRQPHNLQAWMLTIAVNVWRDHVRRVLRRRQLFADDQELDAREGRECAPQDQDYDRAEWGRIVRPSDLRQVGSGRAPERLWEVFDSAFRGLREEERRLLSSFYRNDRRTLPVAIECDLPRQRVKVRVFRARRRLIRGMERRLGCPLAASGSPRPAPEAESVARLAESAA